MLTTNSNLVQKTDRKLGFRIWNLLNFSMIVWIHEIILQVDETAPEKPQPAVQSEEQPETITSNTDEQETIEDIENFIANKPTEEVTQKEAEITPDGQAKGNFQHKTTDTIQGRRNHWGLVCFFWRSFGTIICFRNLLTFIKNSQKNSDVFYG